MSVVARRTRRTALAATALVFGMGGLGFAAVPLYRIFCQATGLNGTTQVADAAQAATIRATGQTVVVRFDANQRSDLPWLFKPERPKETVTVGAKDLAIFIAENKADHPVTGTASYNVQPEQAGKYFTKIQCFCFTQQTLKPGEQVRMPVIFYVDPKFSSDPDTKNIEEITLSYTFYPVGDDKVDRPAKAG